MDEKTQKLIEEIKSDIKTAVEAQYKDLEAKVAENEGKEVSIKQDFEKINEKLDKLEGDYDALKEIKDTVDTLNEAMQKQGEVLESIKNEKRPNGRADDDDFAKAIKQSLINAGFHIEKDENGTEIVSEGGAKLRKFGDSERKKPEFKAAHVITSADVTGQAIPLDYNVMGRDEIPMNTNDHVTEFFQTRTTSRATQMSLIIEYNFEGSPAIRAESASAPLVSMQLKSKEFKIFTAAARATISWEENDDVTEIVERLREIVPDKIKQVIDTSILTDGGDNSASPWGVFNSENGTQFNALEYAGIGGGTANYVDLAMWMQDQCQTADYNGNGLFLGQKMQKVIASLKSTTNDAVIDSRITRQNGVATNVYGMAVKKSRILENYMLVSVTNANRIGIRKNISVVSGFNSDDLEKMQLTFVFYVRYAYGSQNVNANIWSDQLDADLVIINENAAASLARIDGYASGSDASAMTIQMMSNAGGNSLVVANLADYKTAVAAEAGIANAAALQTVIDTVNAA